MYLEYWKPITWRCRRRWLVSIVGANGDVVCRKTSYGWLPAFYTRKKGAERLVSLNKKNNLGRFASIPIDKVASGYSYGDFFHRYAQTFQKT